MVIGTTLTPNWNNEACSVCKGNHEAGRVVKVCPYIYDSSCFVELANIAINDKGSFNYMNSMALNTIVERFPDNIVLSSNPSTLPRKSLIDWTICTEPAAWGVPSFL